jgi:hypothetical protein
MKKTILLLAILFGFLTTSNAQGLEKIIRVETNTSKYRNDNEVPETREYNFKNSKLLSVTDSNYITKYIYNDKGLVFQIVKTYTKNADSDDSVQEYEYNSEGYLIKSIYYSAKNGIKNDRGDTETNYEYNFKNENEYTITGKNVCGNGSKTTCIEENYSMKNNILTATKIVGSIKTVSVFTFKDGNIIAANINKNTRENHTVAFTYDNSPNLNEAIYKNLFGDKYFYNVICYNRVLQTENAPKLSKNILKSSTMEKPSKSMVGFITDDVTIEYNANKLPAKTINNQIVNEGTEKSPRFRIEETYFYE